MTVDNFIANASLLDGLVKNQAKQAGAASNQGPRELENTEGSFDNYDVILCNGQFHVDEIQFRENQKQLTN